MIATGRGTEGIAEVEAGWEILTETTGANTLRAKDIAEVAAKYYAGVQEGAGTSRWTERAKGVP